MTVTERTTVYIVCCFSASTNDLELRLFSQFLTYEQLSSVTVYETTLKCVHFWESYETFEVKNIYRENCICNCLGKLPCPTCRELTTLPANGVAGLRNDFKIQKMEDLFRSMYVKQQQQQQQPNNHSGTVLSLIHI